MKIKKKNRTVILLSINFQKNFNHTQIRAYIYQNHAFLILLIKPPLIFLLKKVCILGYIISDIIVALDIIN